MKHARSRFAVENDYKFVLTHYNRSIRSLVDRMAEATYSPEIALVTCLLFVCIDFLRGNYHSGFTHMKNGLSLIAERRRKEQTEVQSPSMRGADRLSFQHPETKSGADSTTRQIVTLKDFPERRSPNSTSIIENKIVPIFVRGIASALMYGVRTEETLEIPSPVPWLVQGPSFLSFADAQEACYELRRLCSQQTYGLRRSCQADHV